MKFALFVVVALASQALVARAGWPGAKAPLRQHFHMPTWGSESQGNDLEALCKNKGLDIAHLEDLQKLERLAKTDYSERLSCPADLLEKLQALIALVEQGKDNLCAPESIERYIEYYQQNLDTSGDAKGAHLHKSMKRFALAFGQQTSNLCRKELVKTLNERASELLSEEDAKELEALVANEGPVAKVLNLLGGPDEIFLPNDLAPLLKKSNGGKDAALGGGHAMFLQTGSGEEIRKLQAVCQRRLRPVYESLMLPLGRLANLGLSYRDAELRAQLADPAQAAEVARWSRIVFLCESLANIHVVEGANSSEQEVRLLTKDEAEAIEGNTPAVTAPGVTEVVFAPGAPVAIAEPILNRPDEELLAAIKSVKTHRDQQAVLVKRLERRGVTLLKEYLKSGRIGLILSTGFKNLKRKLHIGGGGGDASSKTVSSPEEAIATSLQEVDQDITGGQQEKPDLAHRLNLAIDQHPTLYPLIPVGLLFAIFLTALLCAVFSHAIIYG